jgi:hypothetical protein
VPASATGDQQPTHVGVVSAGVRTRRAHRDDRPQDFAGMLRQFNAGRHWRS